MRKRLDLTRDVPLDVIRESLDVALQAPSGSNQQGWHWLVITDADKRKAIGEYYRESFTAYRNSSAYPANCSWAMPTATPPRTGSRTAPSTSRTGWARSRCWSSARWKAAAELPASNQAGLWGSLLPAAWSFQLALRACGLAARGPRCT
ncbi:hypothetical protein HBB16_08040 [Pseudonocardia sp. MCCB 268]|nr:hypothetical protein [Pseudonocardia cytotoxica]